MKVLLINPPGWQKHSINLGLAYLAGALSADNIETQTLDFNSNFYSQDQVIKIVANYNPQVIGISVKTATANTSAEIANNLKKKFPEALYVVGGPHITLCGEEFLKENKNIDFGILGDGEVSFSQLIRNQGGNKEAQNEVKGLCYYRNNNFICNNGQLNPEISKLPYPSFSSIIDMEFSNFRYPLLTSRGCPYNCIFCCVGMIAGKKWRHRSPDSIIEELTEAKKNYQITSFEIMDDNFTFDIERAKAICRLLIKKKLNLDWWCHNGLRADKLDRQLLRLMKKSGCKSIALGIESGDENIFNNLRKKETLSDVIKSVAMVKAAGINCVGYFIVGLPGESINSIKKTVKLQRSLKLSDHIYNLLVPYPGTKMWELIREKGRFLLDIKGAFHFGRDIKASFELGQLTKERIEQCYFLATYQGWIYGEKDLKKIRETFISRYGSEIKKIFFIAEEGLERISKFIEIEYSNNASVIEAKYDSSVRDQNGKCFIHQNNNYSYFDELFKLAQRKEVLLVDTSRQSISIQKTNKVHDEYVRGECLLPIDKWAKPEGKYYATKLKHSSPDTRSAKNGIIFRDGLPLPFSPAPQWEKVACGKIESGLAFISLAAYNRSSVYTADYLMKKYETQIDELTINDFGQKGNNKISFLEIVLGECDLLFVPDYLEAFAYIVSKAKMSVTYSRADKEKGALKYQILDFPKRKGFKYIVKIIQLKCYEKIIPSLRKLIYYKSNIKKIFQVLFLWAQIITLFLYFKLKNIFSNY